MSAEQKPGFIYVIWAQEQGAIKIGYTADNLKHRLSQLQTGNPHGFGVLGTFRGTKTLEKALHKIFEPYRMSGEWFRAGEALFEFVDDIEDEQVAHFVDHYVDGAFPNFKEKDAHAFYGSLVISEERILEMAAEEVARFQEDSVPVSHSSLLRVSP